MVKLSVDAGAGNHERETDVWSGQWVGTTNIAFAVVNLNPGRSLFSQSPESCGNMFFESIFQCLDCMMRRIEEGHPFTVVDM